MSWPHLQPTLFPYTTLFRSLPAYDAEVLTATKEMSDFFEETVELGADVKQASNWIMGDLQGYMNKHLIEIQDLDRKSTRLNSSHVAISYAVFCLKKKKIITK